MQERLMKRKGGNGIKADIPSEISAADAALLDEVMAAGAATGKRIRDICSEERRALAAAMNRLDEARKRRTALSAEIKAGDEELAGEERTESPSERHERLRKEYAAAREEEGEALGEAQRLYTDLVERRRETIVETLSGYRQMGVPEDRTGLRWGKNSSKALREAVDANCRYFPVDWIAAARSEPLFASRKHESFYRSKFSQESTLRIHPTDTSTISVMPTPSGHLAPDVIVHEMAHLFEDSLGSCGGESEKPAGLLRRAEHAFRARRFEQNGRQTREVDPWAAEKAAYRERGAEPPARPPASVVPYLGLAKLYSSRTYGHDGSTEILSTGYEKLIGSDEPTLGDMRAEREAAYSTDTGHEDFCLGALAVLSPEHQNDDGSSRAPSKTSGWSFVNREVANSHQPKRRLTHSQRLDLSMASLVDTTSAESDPLERLYEMDGEDLPLGKGLGLRIRGGYGKVMSDLPNYKVMELIPDLTIVDGEILVDLWSQDYPGGISHIGGYHGTVMLEDSPCRHHGYHSRCPFSYDNEAIQDYVESVTAALQRTLDRAKAEKG